MEKIFNRKSFNFLLATSLLLTFIAIAGLSIHIWERFRGTQKEDDRGPFSIQSSSLIFSLQNDVLQGLLIYFAYINFFQQILTPFGGYKEP